MRRGVLAYLGAAGLLCLLFHSDNLSLKAAALVLFLVLEGGIVIRARRLRVLLLADVLVTGCVSALLIVSPLTFAAYRWGWLAHALAAGALLAAGSTTGARGRIYWALIGFSLIALPGALLLLPPHYTLVDLVLVLWTLGGLPLIGAGWLEGEAPTLPRLPVRWALIGVIVLGCLVSLRSIHAFPNFSATDEAMIANYADTFERIGKIGSTLIPYPAAVVTGNLYVYAAALWLRAFPGDPFALRTLSALAGLALVGMTFLAGRALSDTLTGATAASLLATNLLWMAVAHVGRQEMALAVFIWAAVWLALAAQKRASSVLALLAGIVVSLSADVHPLGALACVALGGWWIWQLRCEGAQVGVPLRQRRLLFAFVLGGLAGTGYYAAVHILPDPAYFVAGVRDELFSYGAEGSTPWGALVVRHLNYLQSNPLEAGLLLVCALLGLRLRAVRRVGLFLGGLMLLYGVLVADPNPYYPVAWMPGVVLCAALGLRSISERWRVPLIVALVAAFALNVGLIERHVRADWNEQALIAVDQVAGRIPGGERGLSETFFYLAQREPQFTGFTFVAYWAADAGISRWDVVEMLKPDWIVTVQDETAFAPEFAVLSVAVPHMHLEIPDAALAARYHLTDSIPTSVGVFQIWRRS